LKVNANFGHFSEINHKSKEHYVSVNKIPIYLKENIKDKAIPNRQWRPIGL
jgi:hypothetical protein